MPQNDRPLILAPENVERLARLFFLTPTGIQFRGAFADYLAAAKEAADGDNSPVAQLRCSRLDHVVHDFWNLATVIRRSEWMCRLAAKGAIMWPPDWMQYAALDIEAFYVQARSLMDHVAEWLQVDASKRSVTPSSFSELLKKVCDPRTRAALGEDLASVVAGAADWFEPLRDLRDSSVHSGAWTVVVPTPEAGIKFQTYARYPFTKPLVAFETPDDEFQEFRIVGSTIMGRITLLLEDLAGVLIPAKRLPAVAGGFVSAPGFSDFIEWCDAAPIASDDDSDVVRIVHRDGSEMNVLGEVPCVAITYTRSRVHVPLDTGRALIKVLGPGYCARAFELVRGKGMFTNGRMEEISAGVRTVGGGHAFISGRCVITYDEHIVAPPLF